MFANEITKVKDILAFTESKTTVATEGIITSKEEKATKKGDAYVSGTLSCKSDILPFKMWDITLADFEKMVPDGAVQLFGDAQLYEGKISFIVKKIAPSSTPVEQFVNGSYFSPEKMLKTVFNCFNCSNEDILALAQASLDFYYSCGQYNKDAGNTNSVNPILYFPYSPTVHSEKGGLISHIFNTIASISEMGLPKLEPVKGEDGKLIFPCAINLDVVKAAVSMYRLFIMDFFKVDKTTGAILDIDERRLKLEGKTHCLDTLYDWAKAMKVSLLQPDVMNLKHCILVLNGMIEPATPEAVLAKNKVDAELSLTKAMKSGDIISESDIVFHRLTGNIGEKNGNYFLEY